MSRMRLAVVVPIKGRSDLLAQCLGALADAVARVRDAELVLVDNNEAGAPDPEIYLPRLNTTVVSSRKQTVGGVRNDGVNSLRVAPDIVAFVDSDCLVPTAFCESLFGLFATRPHITAAGCKVKAPPGGHWTETASDELHREAGDGPRKHLNSGCLALRFDAFRKVGGFSEQLPANEDYDLCEKISADGGAIWQFEVLQVLHLGNPKSLRGYFRRIQWHGRGVFGETGRIILSPMAIATVANTLVLSVGFLIALYCLWHGHPLCAVAICVSALLACPLAFWLLRMLQYRRLIAPWRAVALMQITFIARQAGMIQQWRLVNRYQR